MVNEEVFTDYLNDTGSDSDWETVRRFIMRARQTVMTAISGKTVEAEHEKAVSFAICNLAEIESAYAERLENGVSSEHIGNYSVSYDSAVNTESRKRAEQKAALCYWLADTGLLYRGCC